MKFVSSDREKLPIFKDRNKIIQMIDRNMVSIVQAETGSGKSTQIPQFILDFSPSSRIAVSQPRRMPAIAVAGRVAEEMNVKLGGKVGYHIKGETCASNSTQITFMTSGILIQIISHIGIEDNLPWDFIIMDEVHERSIEMDFLLVIFKYFLAKGKVFKLVLMSATMQPLIANYFSISSISALRDKHFSVKGETDEFFIDWTQDQDVWKSDLKGKAQEVSKFQDILKNSDSLQIFSADTRRFPIKFCYLKEMIDLANHVIVLDYIRNTGKDAGIISLQEIENVFRNQQASEPEEIDQILFSLASRLILFHVIKTPSINNDTFLVFLPGIQEINTMNEYLQNLMVEDFEKLDVIMLHSSIPEKEHKKVLKPPKPSMKRVILSTNIAESSITLPDVSYVIDFCCSREVVFNQRTMTESLVLVWAAKSTMKQRAGRSGRVSEGTVFRLMPLFHYEKLKEYATPEMQRTCLDKIILKLKLMNFADPKKILLETIQPPSNDQISASESFLQEMGAIDQYGKISRLGRIYVDMPFDIRVTRLCVFGIMFHCLPQAILCAAVVASEKQPVLSLAHLRATESIRHPETYRKRLQFAKNSNSDLIMCVNAFKFWYSRFGEKVEQEMFRNGHRHLRAARPNFEERRFCNSHFLDPSSLREILSNSLEMKEKLVNFGVDPVYLLQNADEKVLKVCIAAAFCDRILVSRYEIGEERVRKREIEMLGNSTRKVYFNCQQDLIDKRDVKALLGICIEEPKRIEESGSMYVIEYHERVHEKTLKMALWLGNYGRRYLNSAWIVLKEERSGRVTAVKPAPAILCRVPADSRREGAVYTLNDRGKRFHVAYLKRLEYPYKLVFHDLPSGMTVKIEEDSVNYISISTDAEKSNSYTLICSDYIERSRNFIGKNTTLLPINEVLPFILVLVFTPHINYVAHKDNSRYAGFAVPGHSTVEFKFLFTHKDAVKVNEIRDRISNFASNNDYFLDSGLDPEVFHEIWQLCQAEHVKVRPTYPDWVKILNFEIKNASLDTQTLNYGGFLPPIPLLALGKDLSVVTNPKEKIQKLKEDYLNDLNTKAKVFDVKEAYLVCGECMQIITEISKLRLNSSQPLSFFAKVSYGALCEKHEPDTSELANEICTFFIYNTLEYCNSGHLVGWSDSEGTYIIGSAKLKILLPMVRYEDLNAENWANGFSRIKNLENKYLLELSRFKVDRTCKLCNEVFKTDEQFSHHVQISKTHETRAAEFREIYVV